MEAFKCDRCKKFYTRYDFTTKENPFNNVREASGETKSKPDELYEFKLSLRYGKTFYSGASQIGTMDENIDWDICPECAKKFMKLLFTND